MRSPKECVVLSLALICVTVVGVANGNVADYCPGTVDTNLCNNDTLDCCLGDLNRLGPEANEAVVPILDEDEARQHCRLYVQFEECMLASRDNCQLGDRLLFEGIEASYEYWCEETFDEYLQHQPCLANTDLHVDGQQCSDNFDESIDNIDGSRGWRFVRERKCHYAENYLDCVFNAVKHHCSFEAAKWQAGFDARSLKPILEATGCIVLISDQDNRDNNEDNEKILIALIASLGVVLIVICVLVALVCVWRKKKPRRPTESEPPPPYMAGAQPYVVYNPETGAQMMGGMGEAGPLPQKAPAYSNGQAGRRPSQGGRSDGRSDGRSNAGRSQGGRSNEWSDEGRRPSQGGRSDGRSMGSNGNSHLGKQSEMTYNRY